MTMSTLVFLNSLITRKTHLCQKCTFLRKHKSRILNVKLIRPLIEK